MVAWNRVLHVTRMVLPEPCAVLDVREHDGARLIRPVVAFVTQRLPLRYDQSPAAGNT